MQRLLLVVALCLAALSSALCSNSRGVLQDTSEADAPPSDESFVRPIQPEIPFFLEFQEGRPRAGSVEFRAPQLFGFVALRRDQEFPDMLLSLDVLTPGASVDLYCRPQKLRGGGTGFTEPFITDAVWRSDHTHGTDYVFISRNDTALLETVDATNTRQGVQLFVGVVCALWSLGSISSEFELSLDVEYSSRTLMNDELEAVQSIYQKCCEGGCPPWVDARERLFGGTPDGDLPVFDLCHVPPNFCNPEGRLIRFDMAGWGLDCEFPVDELKKMRKLEKLDLSSNRLTGDIFKIARGLNTLKELEEFRASNNLIEGFLDIGPVCNLGRGNMKVLGLANNQLNGPLPECLFDFTTKLTDLRLGDNNLSSSIPDVFPEGSTYSTLNFASAGISGALPSSLGNLSALRNINFENNSLTGELTDAMFQSEALTTVKLKDNALSGKVPSSLAISETLLLLSLSGNMFTELPEEWGEPSLAGQELKELDLEGNNISSGFPAAFARMRRLAQLNLANNNFSGPLPSEPTMFLETWNLILANNSFTGTIPAEWGTIGILIGSALDDIVEPPRLDLSNNMLTGDLPAEFLENRNVPSKTVLLGGNDLNCPEDANISHIGGLECGN